MQNTARFVQDLMTFDMIISFCAEIVWQNKTQNS